MARGEVSASRMTLLRLEGKEVSKGIGWGDEDFGFSVEE